MNSFHKSFLKKVRISISVLIMMFLIYIPAMIVDKETFMWLEKEDGFYEYLGSFLFLFASITFFKIYFSHKKLGLKRNLFFLGLAIVFFMGFGEEISWGQRILGFDNPDLFDEINAQHEFNIHNLYLFHGDTVPGVRKSTLQLFLNVDRLFSIFWLSFCVLTPAFEKLSSRFSLWIQKIRFPLVPLSIGILFPVNYLMSKILSFYIPRNFVEIKETNFALLFFAVAYYLYKQQKSDSKINPILKETLFLNSVDVEKKAFVLNAENSSKLV